MISYETLSIKNIIHVYKMLITLTLKLKTVIKHDKMSSHGYTASFDDVIERCAHIIPTK